MFATHQSLKVPINAKIVLLVFSNHNLCLLLQTLEMKKKPLGSSTIRKGRYSSLVSEVWLVCCLFGTKPLTSLCSLAKHLDDTQSSCLSSMLFFLHECKQNNSKSIFGTNTLKITLYTRCNVSTIN